MTGEESLIQRVRSGQANAWEELIARYEGRLLGYIERRVDDRATAEDLVQETFIGLLNSLPNYDGRRALENYLFSIAAHKLTDHFRRCGRRPALTGIAADDSRDPLDRQPGRERGPSTLLAGAERRRHEVASLTAALQNILTAWREQGRWDKIRAAELLFVLGMANKAVAAQLEWSEQAVANFKHDLIERLRGELATRRTDLEIFPELQA